MVERFLAKEEAAGPIPVSRSILFMLPTKSNSQSTQLATFAGGCFWCMVGPFRAEPGVVSVVAGYSGGTTVNPTYEQVCAGDTGHLEVIQVTFDPSIVSYPRLLEIFWQQIDPTDELGQFADKGLSYTTAIFYHTLEQKEQAEAARKKLEDMHIYTKPIVTKLLEFKVFYPAEDYHQDYDLKNPFRYSLYKSASGRQSHIDEYKNKISLNPPR